MVNFKRIYRFQAILDIYFLKIYFEGASFGIKKRYIFMVIYTGRPKHMRTILRFNMKQIATAIQITLTGD